MLLSIGTAHSEQLGHSWATSYIHILMEAWMMAMLSLHICGLGGLQWSTPYKNQDSIVIFTFLWRGAKRCSLLQRRAWHPK